MQWLWFAGVMELLPSSFVLFTSPVFVDPFLIGILLFYTGSS
jgi:hypothetical protein